MMKNKNTYSSISDIMLEYDISRYNKDIEYIEHINKIYDLYPELKKIYDDIIDINTQIAKSHITNDEEKIFELKKVHHKLLDEYKNVIKTNNIDLPKRIFECDKCNDTGFINGKKCDCLLKKENLLNKNLSLITNNFTYTKFEDLDLSMYKQKNVVAGDESSYEDYITDKIDKIKHRIDNLSEQALNLYISGPIGVGKTTIANCIATYANENNHDVLFYTANDLIQTFFKNEQDVKEKDRISVILRNVDVLVIDDLGTENNSAFSNSILFSIIDKRYCDNLSTIITSNLDFDGIKKLYSERIYSRISNLYQFLILYGRDLREGA